MLSGALRFAAARFAVESPLCNAASTGLVGADGPREAGAADGTGIGVGSASGLEHSLMGAEE